jgi:hypothetical protein
MTAVPAYPLHESLWYYAQDRTTKVGPLTWHQIRQLAFDGALKPSDMVLQNGNQKWVQAADVPELIVGPGTAVPVRSRLQQFQHDLSDVHSKIRKPHDFAAELALRFDHRREKIRKLRSRFLADLSSTYDAITRVDPRKYIPTLEGLFDRCRETARTKIAKILANISADDPIKCPISLFETMRFGRLETAHTRVLAWLLDPTQRHEFGSTLLEALWAKMEGTSSPTRPSVDEVVPEKLIPLEGNKTGRLDVFVRGRFLGNLEPNPWILCIEAKIDAEEGEKQLPKYDKWIEATYYGHEIKRVFLTPDGREPETSKKWQALSFVQLATVLRSRLSSLKDTPGYHYLRFYLTAVMKDICHWSLPIRDANSCSDPYGVLQYLIVDQLDS